MNKRITFLIIMIVFVFQLFSCAKKADSVQSTGDSEKTDFSENLNIDSTDFDIETLNEKIKADLDSVKPYGQLLETNDFLNKNFPYKQEILENTESIIKNDLFTDREKYVNILNYLATKSRCCTFYDSLGNTHNLYIPIDYYSRSAYFFEITEFSIEFAEQSFFDGKLHIFRLGTLWKIEDQQKSPFEHYVVKGKMSREFIEKIVSQISEIEIDSEKDAITVITGGSRYPASRLSAYLREYDTGYFFQSFSGVSGFNQYHILDDYSILYIKMPQGNFVYILQLVGSGDIFPSVAFDMNNWESSETIYFPSQNR